VRGKKAKALRRMAKMLANKPDKKGYIERLKLRTGETKRVILWDPQCARGIYRRIKRV
jgi:hypothetical protein